LSRPLDQKRDEDHHEDDFERRRQGIWKAHSLRLAGLWSDRHPVVRETIQVTTMSALTVAPTT